MKGLVTVLSSSKSSYMAKGGLFVTLTIIILYSTTFLQFNTLFLIGIASAVIPLCLISTDIRTSFLVYIASSILGYFILPVKSTWMLYVILFGPYGVIKYFVEKLRNIPLEIVLKLLYFNIISYLAFYLYKLFFVPNLNLPYNIILIILGAQFAFYLFDYALTVFINTAMKYSFRMKH
jgi:hypothetical protein